MASNEYQSFEHLISAGHEIAGHPKSTWLCAPVGLALNLDLMNQGAMDFALVAADTAGRTGPTGPEGVDSMMQDMVPDVPRFVRKRVISAGPRSNLRSLADVVEGLFAEFGSLALPTVLATVRHCRRELDIAGRQYQPDALEQLARRPLQALARVAAASDEGSLRAQAISHPPPVFPLQRRQPRRPAI